jgi:Chlorophyll A-B binding protein
MIKIICQLIIFIPVVKAITSSVGSRRTSWRLAMNWENAVGAQPPLGFWDPLGLLKNADQRRFDRLRYVEIKHGRISMLAILGHIVTTTGIRLPGEIIKGELPFTSIRSGLAALEDLPLSIIGLLIAFIGILEIGYSARQEDIEEAQLRASGWDEETIAWKSAVELNNGRAAQMGILGLMVHEKLDNNPYIINSLLGYPVPFNGPAVTAAATIGASGGSNFREAVQSSLEAIDLKQLLPEGVPEALF